MTCREEGRIDRHFEGTISPEDERAMREHLPLCPACHAHYERWLLLSRVDARFGQGSAASAIALPAEVRIARGLGIHSRPRVARPLGVALVATLVAVAAALLLWVRPGADRLAFTARGGALKTAVSRVFVYDVHPGKPIELAAGTVARGDELAFAYENAAAKDRLMIFGVDEHRHVYWFYPAWVSPAENPVAIPIEQDALRHELPEAVRQNFDGARLEIHSLFVDTPVTVAQVEAMIQEDPARPLPIPSAIETPVSFVVSP
jgi:hypothetical protein